MDATPVSGNKGLWLRKQNIARVEGIYFHSLPARLHKGIVAENCYEIHGYRTHVNATIADGMTFQTCLNVFWWDSQVATCEGNGLALLNNQGVRFTRVESLQNLIGWLIGSAGGTLSQDHFFEQCLGDGSVGNNWQIEQLATAKFTKCWGCTQADATTDPDARGWVIYGSNTRNLHFVSAPATTTTAMAGACWTSHRHAGGHDPLLAGFEADQQRPRIEGRQDADRADRVGCTGLVRIALTRCHPAVDGARASWLAAERE